MTDNNRILIVEDSSTQAMQLKMILEQNDYNVTVAKNGIEALERFQQQFFPIVITDWIMPKMNGLEFCRNVRRQNFSRYTYIIIVTARAARGDIIAGLESGADDYLIKPVHHTEIIARLKTARRVLSLETSLKKLNAEITLLTITDPLTKAYNRRYFSEFFPKALLRAFRYGHPISLMICDIDHFKRVNDEYGHQVGDFVLEVFAHRLIQSTRDGSDWVVRYGGEEFAIILPESDMKAACGAAERFRRLVSEKPIPFDKGSITITASFGIATLMPSEKGKKETVDTLLAHADKCLYKAKGEGRNRVVSVCLG